MNTQVFTVSISTMTPSKSDTAVVPDILEEIRQIKEQNLEILRLMRVARDRRWYNLQGAGERLTRGTADELTALIWDSKERWVKHEISPTVFSDSE